MQKTRWDLCGGGERHDPPLSVEVRMFRNSGLIDSQTYEAHGRVESKDDVLCGTIWLDPLVESIMSMQGMRGSM